MQKAGILPLLGFVCLLTASLSKAIESQLGEVSQHYQFTATTANAGDIQFSLLGYIEDDGQTVLFRQQRTSSSFLLVSSLVQAYLTASQGWSAELTAIPTAFQMSSLLLLVLSATQTNISLNSPLQVSVTPPSENDNSSILQLTIGSQETQSLTLRTSVKPRQGRFVRFDDQKNTSLKVAISISHHLYRRKLWESSYSVDDDGIPVFTSSACRPVSKWRPYEEDDGDDEGGCFGCLGRLFSGSWRASSGASKKTDESSRLLGHSHTTVNSCAIKQITNDTFTPVQLSFRFSFFLR